MSSFASKDLIIVTLSGGGIRAAALAAATLETIRRFTKNSRSLSENIIMISSVSGGSVAAIFIAKHGFGNYPYFRKIFLEKDNTMSLLDSSLNTKVVNDRSAILQDYLEEKFALGGITFGDVLEMPDRPFFVFNSTDLATGQVFRFTQGDFGYLLCSNLSKVPLSLGAAASAALPFAFTDVELVNRWNSCNQIPDARLDPTYQSETDKSVRDAVDVRHQRYMYEFQHAYDDDNSVNQHRRRPKYLHLADGGMVDNLGARAVESVLSKDQVARLSHQLSGHNDVAGIHQILVVEINARAEKPYNSLNANAGSPSFITTAGIVTSIPIDATSTLSSRDANTAWLYVFGGGEQTLVQDDMVMKAQIDFDLLPDDNGDDVNDADIDNLRNRVKSIGMGFSLKEADLKALEQASNKLLEQSACFKRFVEQASFAPPPDFQFSPYLDSNDCLPVKARFEKVRAE